MIVARWQCKLRPSRLACGCLCAWLVAAVPGVMLMTLPVGGWLIKMLVILLMLTEGWRCYRRLIRRHGTLQRESVHCWIWQGKRWRPTQPLRWLPIGVLLVAKNEQGAMLRWWLMQDNMQPDEWRALRASCFSKARH